MSLDVSSLGLILALSQMQQGQQQQTAQPDIASYLGGGLGGVNLLQNNSLQRFSSLYQPAQQPQPSLMDGFSQLLSFLLIFKLLQKFMNPANPVTPGIPGIPRDITQTNIYSANNIPVLGTGQQAAETAVINNNTDFHKYEIKFTGDFLTFDKFDPSKESAVFIALGQRNTGGYSINVKSVQEIDGKIVVRWSEKSPGAGDAVTQAITSPGSIFKFANPNKLPIEVIKE